MVECSKFHRLNFPDPHNYGDEYRPVFPMRHKALKAIMDNIPPGISKIYIFGSSIGINTGACSDLDVCLIGTVANHELSKIWKEVPDGEKIDFIIETQESFDAKLNDGWSSLYQKIYEGGYKIYEAK